MMRKILLFISLVLMLESCPFPLLSQGYEESDSYICSFADVLQASIASGREEPVTMAPANVFVITGDEMMARGYRSLFDLLYDLPGVIWNNQTGNDKNGVPVIRGMLEQRRLKLLLNGMQIDEKAGSGFGWDARLPVEGIEKVEFILGPYSCLYGRNTFSGVLNVVTKSGNKMKGGLADFLYGSWGREQGSVVMGGKKGGWDLFFSAFENRSEKGQDMTKEYPELYSRENREGRIFEGEPVSFASGVSKDWNLFWDNRDYYVKLKSDTGIQIDYDYNEANWPMAGTLLTPLFYTQPTDSGQNDKNQNTRILFEHSFDWGQSTTSLQYQDWENEGKIDYIDGLFKWYVSSTESLSFDQKCQVRMGEKNNLFLGFSYEGVHALIPQASERLSVPTKPVIRESDYLDLTYLNLSIQDEITLTENLKSVIGLMYEHSNSYRDVYLPRASFVWALSKDTIVKFLYGGGYLAPDLLTRMDQIVGETGNVKGTSDIKPEMLTSYEIDLTHQFNEKIHLTASLYINSMHDFIVTDQDPSIGPFYSSTYKNMGKQETRGGELEINYRPTDKVTLFSSFAHVEGYYEQFDEMGDFTKIHDLPMSSEDHIKTGFNILLMDKINFYIHDLFLGRIHTWDSETLPGYNLVDLCLTTAKNFSDRFWFSLGVTNFFDKKAFDSPVDNDPGWIIASPIKRRGWTMVAGIRW